MKNVETPILDQPAKKVYILSRVYASKSVRVMVSSEIEGNVEFQSGVKAFDRLEALSYSVFLTDLTIHRPASVMHIPELPRRWI